MRYVKANLISAPELVSRQPGRPLLDFALRRRIYSAVDGQAEQLDYPVGGVLDKPDVELVRMILDHGGDPNGKFAGATVWKFFMGFLDAFGNSLRRLDAEGVQAWIDVTELLIRHGAVRVLENEVIVPQQPMRTRVKLSSHVVLARTSIAAAFGDEEAARLDFLSWKLSATGQNLLTKISRGLRSLLGNQSY